MGIGLNIEKISYSKKLNLTQKSINIIKNNLKTLGYHHSRKPDFNSPIQDMKKLLKKVSDLGLPPVFSFVYDEFWYIQWQIKHVLEEILGKNYKQLQIFGHGMLIKVNQGGNLIEIRWEVLYLRIMNPSL